jgi:hypothetical protein
MKLAILSFFAAIMLLATNISKAQVVNIPDKAKTHFAQKYPNATEVDWSNKVSNYTAKFRMDNKPYEAHYSIDGDWDNTEHPIQKSDLPEVVSTSFSKNRFADWKLNSIDFVDDSKNASLYRFNLKKGIEKKYLYLDSTGKEVKATSGL